MYASRYSNPKIVKLLLEQEGIDINAKNNNGDTALMLASEYGFIKRAKLLLDKGIDINVKNKDGKTALNLATENGHKEIVKLLLEQKRINTNIQDNNGNTAFTSDSNVKKIVKVTGLAFLVFAIVKNIK